MQGYGHVRRKPHAYSESHLQSSRAALHVFAVQVCIMCTLARRSLRSATTTTPSSSRGSLRLPSSRGSISLRKVHLAAIPLLLCCSYLIACFTPALQLALS